MVVKSRGVAAQEEGAREANADIVPEDPVGNQQSSSPAPGQQAGEEDNDAEVHAQDEGRNIRRMDFDDPEAFWSDVDEGEEESPW